MRILLVDDDPSMLRLLDKYLSHCGHEVIHANNGEEAWGIVSQEKISLVISDWCMPRMDGVELCQKLRKPGINHYVYIILITGKNQTEDLVEAMEAGADDFLSKPVQARELEMRIKAGRRILSMEKSLTENNHELQYANNRLRTYQERINRDLDAAARVQQALLPQTPLRNFSVELAWNLIPAEVLAGDIFNFYALDDHHLGFYLVDVSGHGIPAAMLSVYLAKTLSPEPRPDSLIRPPTEETGSKAHYKNHREPKDVAARLNNHFAVDERTTLYCTMIYGVLDTQTGMGTLCQAGHPHPLVCRHDGTVQRLGSGGFPIGLVPGASYEQFDFQLDPGDRLVIYSDGITECFNPTDEAFGEQRLADCLTDCRSSSLQETAGQIESRIANWHHPNQQSGSLSDDASFLAIEWTGEVKHQ